MELSDVWRALLRRWYFLLVGILATVGATWFVATSVGPTYHVEGSVLLLPPEIAQDRDPTAQVQGNPYLFLGGLTAARDVVVKAVTSRTARDGVDAIAPGAEYEVTPDFDSSGPIFLIRVDAPTEESSLAGLDALIESIPPTLRDLQDGLQIESSAYISARVITRDVTPETVRKDQIRAAIATAAATAALGVLVIGVLDGLMGGRQRRQPARTRPGRSSSTRPAPRDDADPSKVVVAAQSEPETRPVPVQVKRPPKQKRPSGGPAPVASSTNTPAASRRESGRKRRRQQAPAGDADPSAHDAGASADDGQKESRPADAAPSAR